MFALEIITFTIITSCFTELDKLSDEVNLAYVKPNTNLIL